MNTRALDLCLGISEAHARLQRKLDDELGTLHGLSLADFVLLSALGSAPSTRLSVQQLTRPLGVQASAVVRQVIALEKTGLVRRESAEGRRWISMSAAGRRLQGEASETAATVCAAAVGGIAQEALAAADAMLGKLRDSTALEMP